jgi:hypothetical protein
VPPSGLVLRARTLPLEARLFVFITSERSAKKRSDRARVEGPLHFFPANHRLREFSPVPPAFAPHFYAEGALTLSRFVRSGEVPPSCTTTK